MAKGAVVFAGRCLSNTAAPFNNQKEDVTMGFKSDIEIAQECTMEPITKIAEKAGIDEKYLEQY